MTAISPDGPVRIPSQDWLRDQSIAFLDTTNSLEITTLGVKDRDDIAGLYAKSVYRQAFDVPNRAWLYEQTAALLEALEAHGFNPADMGDRQILTQLWADHIYNNASQREVCEGFQKLRKALP